MQEVRLTLNIDETNLVLEALGNLPFVRVYTLISRIQEQAARQVASENAPTSKPLMAVDNARAAGNHD